MKTLLSLNSLAVVIAGVLAGSVGSAQAWNFSPVRNNNGPIVIQGPIECEKKLVQKCHWEGNRKVCVWVPGPDCQIY